MITLNQILKIIWISMLPIGELRVSIPLAIITYHWSYGLAFLIGVFGNLLFILPLSWLLDLVILKWIDKQWFGYKLLDKILIRARYKVQDAYSKWAKWGLAIFVGIPLPLTGAWTGTLGARLLGLSHKDTFIYTGIGVIMAGCIVTLATFLINKGIHFFFI